VRLTAPFLRTVTLRPTDSDQYPFTVRAFRAGIDLTLDRPVTFFVGENGCGKSTLLESIAIASGFCATGGGREHLGSSDGEPRLLADALALSWRPKVTDGFFMRAESFFDFANYLVAAGSTHGRYGGKSLHEQSHGESFLSLFTNRFDRGLFILDEPEAALSPQRQLSFLTLLHELDTGGGAQFLIASHSPILLAYPRATLLSLDGDGISPIRYADTDHYRVTRDFLAAPERYFKHLFGGDDGD
jgi:predicted ATPase